MKKLLFLMRPKEGEAPEQFSQRVIMSLKERKLLVEDEKGKWSIKPQEKNRRVSSL